MSKSWKWLAGCILVFTGTLSAQEAPLTIKSTLSSGFYSASTRGAGSGDQSIRFVPGGALFDINSYYLTPDLVDFWIQPELDAGPQASEAGFQGGNGVRTRASFLRQRAFPVTFRYSNVELENVYFGSLSQLSSYTLKNRSKDLGFSTQLKPPGLPAAVIDWGVSSVDSKSAITALPDYKSQTGHINLDSDYVRWGWDLKGFAHHQKQTSNPLSSPGQGANSPLLEQNVTQYQGSARRNLRWDSELYLDAGTESTSNVLLNQPIDLTTRHANVNLRLLQRRKWKTSLRAGYTSNIAGLLLNQLVGDLSGSGSLAPDASVLQPLHRSISSFNINALTSFDLSHGLGLYGSADRTAVLSAGNNVLDSRYLTTAAGMTYSRHFRWVNLSGQYGRDFGAGSVTGQSGRLGGQNYNLTAQRGDRDGLQLDFSLHGTSQNVRNAQSLDNQSFAWDGSVARRVFRQFSARVGGGWQQNTFTSASTDFHSGGYTSHAGIDHPRFQLDVSLNVNTGNALRAYNQLVGGIGAAAALLTPLQAAASDLRGVSFNLHANPTRKIELSALRTHSVQHLEGVVANDFDVLDAHATYHYRRLQFQSGYFRSYQTFSSYLANSPETRRGRFYVRVSRSFRLI